MLWLLCCNFPIRSLNLKFKMIYNVIRTQDYKTHDYKTILRSFLAIPNKIRLSKIKARDLIRNINSLTQTLCFEIVAWWYTSLKQFYFVTFMIHKSLDSSMCASFIWGPNSNTDLNSHFFILVIYFNFKKRNIKNIYSLFSVTR